MEILNDDALEAAIGGAGVNTSDWTRGHWQPQDHPMGSTWTENGRFWYRIRKGDSLSRIAKEFGTNTTQLRILNPATIADVNHINAGDAIVIRKV